MARVLARTGLWVLGAALLAYVTAVAVRDLPRLGWGADSLLAMMLAAALSGGAQLAMHLRWWLLLPRGRSPVPTAAEACGVGFVGSLSDYAMFGGLGGMTVRAAWLVRRHGFGKAAAVAGVFLDRAIGLATLIAIGAAAVLALFMPVMDGYGVRTSMAWVVCALFAAATALTAAWLSRGLWSSSAAARLSTARIALLAISGRRFAAAVVLSFASQLLAAGSLAAVASAFPAETSGFLRHCASLAAGEFASAIAPVPGGIGVREAAMTSSYEGLAVSGASPPGAAIGLGSRAVALLVTLAGAVSYGVRMWVSPRRPARPGGGGSEEPGSEVAAAAKLRILIVANYAPPHVGGVEVLVDREARLLARAGHDVLIVTSDCGDGPPPDYPEGVRVQRIPAWNVLERRFDIPWPLFSPVLARSLWRAVWWCDVVHAHGFLGVNSLVAMAAARLSAGGGKPSILTEHAGRSRYEGLTKSVLQEAAVRTLGGANVRLARDRIVCHDRVRETLERIGAGPGNVRLLLFPPDRELFHPPTQEHRAAARRALGWEDGRPKVLFVGRLTRRKGTDLLLDARTDRFDLVFCGPGDPSILGHVDGTRVSYFGPRPRQALVRLYHAADALALPSRSEGNLPLVVQEALSTGLPVIMGDDPGLSRFRSCPGLTFAPLEPSALQEAIIRALAAGRPNVGPGRNPFSAFLPNEEEWIDSLFGLILRRPTGRDELPNRVIRQPLVPASRATCPDVPNAFAAH